MVDIAYRNDEVVYTGNRISWGAIWAGVFTFISIWSVFGMLAEGIFSSSANPNAPAPVGGMTVGMGIWSTILTIIAMYVAGRATAHFANVSDRAGRIFHGMAMFGLSVIAFVLVVILGGSAMSGGVGIAGSTHSPYMLTVFSDIGWIGFVSLFLGWLAAMGGAAHGPVGKRQQRQERNLRDVRPAA